MSVMTITAVVQPPAVVQAVVEPPEQTVVQLTVGQGPSAPTGVAAISSDAGNVLRVGSDHKFFVPAHQWSSAQW